ncbi:MAG: serine/threonine-protein kinase [Pseudomonadota bacterium]
MGQAASAASSDQVPAKIGKYVIINKVGHGSTGNVYLSHDPYYRRDVAIKVYDIDHDTDDAERARVARKMFFNEAHMVGMLQHPNILPIYDAGEENGKYYVVTEYIQGARTLAGYCKPDNLLRIDDVVEIIYKCAKALHYAHGRGVIHRDIKPSNIMLTPENDVRIIDFGIAIVTDSDISQIRGIAGSPSYMSPEQVQAEDLTNRSDIYSLGAVMYELLTGFRPFRAGNLSKLLHQIVYATPQPIHRFREEVTDQLESIVAIALQKEPGKRYSNGLALAAELTRVYKDLRAKYDQLDNQEHFDRLRQLRFFHEFSQSEIWEVLRAGDWSDYRANDEIVKEGEIEDRFFIIVSGDVDVSVNGQTVGSLREGDCFGESSYVAGAKNTASIKAAGPVTALRVGATLMEQMSSSCQLRFNKEFLRSLIKRLQSS